MNAALAASSSAGRRNLPAAAPQTLRLIEKDRDAVLNHFVSLDPASRQLRFMQATSDDMLACYVAAIDFQSSTCFGTFDPGGQLIAVTEGLTCRGSRYVEAAFSTDAMWRRQGLARRGFAALEVWCIDHGIEGIVFTCHVRNVPMRGVLRSLAAMTTVDDGEVNAIMRLSARHTEGPGLQRHPS